jgi:preprotein translocase subunit SecE
LHESPAVLKLASILVGLLLAAGVAWTSEPGKRFFAFAQDSVAEAKRVVWPTRKETIQTTAVVIAFAVTMALFLWAVDASLMVVVNKMMGRGE